MELLLEASALALTTLRALSGSCMSLRRASEEDLAASSAFSTGGLAIFSLAAAAAASAARESATSSRASLAAAKEAAFLELSDLAVVAALAASTALVALATARSAARLALTASLALSLESRWAAAQASRAALASRYLARSSAIRFSVVSATAVAEEPEEAAKVEMAGVRVVSVARFFLEGQTSLKRKARVSAASSFMVTSCLCGLRLKKRLVMSSIRKWVMMETMGCSNLCLK